jgi:pimeloyl-ACP methyl ester carboxylesterase
MAGKAAGETIFLIGAKMVGMSIRAALVLCLTVGCAPIASVTQTRARIPYSKQLQPELSAARRQLARGQELEGQDPLAALGNDLAAAQIAAKQLHNRSSQIEARELYNFAVGRVVENIEHAHLEPWRRSITIPSSSGDYLLSSPQPANGEHDPSNYTLLPTDVLRIGGRLFTTRTTVTGVGAPVLAIGREKARDDRTRFALKRVYAAVTAVVRFQDHRAEIEFIERSSTNQVVVAGRTHPLAADFTAPLAMTLVLERPDKYRLGEFLRPEKYADTARLIFLQRFDPQRTPVIFVHGLHETPSIWAPVINSICDDPELRRRYQFWVFTYPGGYSYPYAAVLLRRQLDEVAKTFPNRKPIVLVGYSMGGVVCRLMVTDAGEKIWRAFFGKPPAETPIAGRTRYLLEESLVFNHRPEVKRVIFMATPHRGSFRALDWRGRLLASLIQAPQVLANLRQSVFPILTFEPAALRLNQFPNAVNTLAPDNPFILEMNKIPITPNIPYHTIEGDRGRGDAPNSSDGLVAYWSSHLEGAQSEVIVSSDHYVTKNADAIAEVKRILGTSH